MTAAEIIALRSETMRLERHPHEGGWYRETFRDPRLVEGRAASTAILFLLDVGEVSEWHRVDAVEVWHWHAGAPLVITTSPNGHDATAVHLGPGAARGAASASRRAGRPLADRDEPGGLDPGRVHGRPRLFV